VLTDPWVARIYHDDRPRGYIDHPAITYYGAYVGSDVAGVLLAIENTPEDIGVHVALRRWATPHGRALGHLFINAVFADHTVQRLTAEVLGTLPSAANYCRRLGFEDEGVRRNACRVDGRLTDVVMLGLLRDQRAQ